MTLPVRHAIQLLGLLGGLASAASGPPSQVNALIGPQGGRLVLGAAQVTVPPRFFTQSARVTLSRLSSPPLHIPLPYRVTATYQLTASQPARAGSLSVVLPHARHDPQVFNELYILEGRRYGIAQLGGYEQSFQYDLEYFALGKIRPNLKEVFVVTEVGEAALLASLSASGGQFNGVYGECPEGKMLEFGRCLPIPDLP